MSVEKLIEALAAIGTVEIRRDSGSWNVAVYYGGSKHQVSSSSLAATLVTLLDVVSR